MALRNAVCEDATNRVNPRQLNVKHLILLHLPGLTRLVEEMLLELGVAVYYETIRRWGWKFRARVCRSPAPQEAFAPRHLASR
jgi:hypothetical protein